MSSPWALKPQVPHRTRPPRRRPDNPSRSRCNNMATTVIPAQPISRPTNYLTNGFTLKSWLLTTDHKRIAILYLISVTLFFFLGGFFAMLIRLELLTPQGDLMHADSYNKVFTAHGIIMVFFFLIPVVPA